MNKSVIIIFALLIFIQVVIAEESIIADIPNNVYYGEEFFVTISLEDFDDDTYDIKIDIKLDGERIAQILNDDDWKSTFNYVNDAIEYPDSDSEEFSLNITVNEQGEAEIVIKARNSDGDVITSEDYTIDVLASDNNDEEEEEDKDNNDEIDFELKWIKKSIINGDTFDIEIEAENLENEEYDVKIWIEDDKGVIISDRFDKEEDEWKSGRYYVEDILEGSGDDSVKIELRIKEKYNDLSGDYKISARIKGVSETVDETIEILIDGESNKNEDDDKNDEDEKSESNNGEDDIYEDYQKYIQEQAKKFEQEPIKQNKITGNVIKLGKSKQTEDIKTEKTNNIKQTDQTKIIALVLFSFLSLTIAVLLALGKIK